MRGNGVSSQGNDVQRHEQQRATIKQLGTCTNISTNNEQTLPFEEHEYEYVYEYEFEYESECEYDYEATRTYIHTHAHAGAEGTGGHLS